ncbi:MAG TPA: GTPase ObgE, partial [Bacteroidales bacterium]|nr:GTPase ObgE [Bacteroidales bacterium]
LRKYKPELLDKQRILAVTKTDLLDSESEKEIAKHIPRSLPVVLISSVTGKNITLLKEKIWDLLSSQ